ncbi:MAG: NAD-dependent epimerase/dehydratase family protein [Methanobacteriaceae archaeon]
MENKKVLVTGGLGFIGSHIVNKLVENNEVIVIDNESTGKIENLTNQSHKNLELLLEDLNVIADSNKLESVISDVNYVFHHSAMASVPLSVENPIECNENNIDATLKLLTASKNSNVEKLVFASSSAVYGENTNMPLKESENFNVLSPYASSKASCELYCQSFKDSYDFNSICFRYFNVFGPKQDVNSAYAAVIPQFIYSLLNDESPTIYGDGEQSRDFIYVEDVVKANILACESNYNGVLNLATGKTLSINELFYVIRDIIGSNIEPNYEKARAGDIKHSSANIDKLKNINFKADLNFEKQLKETVNWFKSSI